MSSSSFGDRAAYQGGQVEGVRGDLAGAIIKAMRHPAFIECIHGLGLDVVTSESPAAFWAFVHEEVERWRPIVQASGARID